MKRKKVRVKEMNKYLYGEETMVEGKKSDEVIKEMKKVEMVKKKIIHNFKILIFKFNLINISSIWKYSLH